MFHAELYTVTVLTEAAMMGADIDGDVLVYLDMAQVIHPVRHHFTDGDITQGFDIMLGQTFVNVELFENSTATVLFSKQMHT